MKIIIAGSRSFTNYSLLSTHLDHLFKCLDVFQTEIVSGHARGTDQLGERYADEHKLIVHPFPVTAEDWKRIGKSAGYRRNKEMAQFADALVAFWDGSSRGTSHMIDLAREHGLRVHIVRI